MIKNNSFRIVECAVCRPLARKFLQQNFHCFPNYRRLIDSFSCCDFIEFVYNPFLVRGHDYYSDNGLIFEVFFDLKNRIFKRDIDSKHTQLLELKNLAICGGGFYDS